MMKGIDKGKKKWNLRIKKKKKKKKPNNYQISIAEILKWYRVL